MLVLEKYQIEQKFLDGVPQEPYKDGVGNYRGVVAHETANWGSGASEDTVLGERNWEQQDWKNAFVHYFVDYQTILNVAPLEYLSWGCGKGNSLYVNVELCRTKEPIRFEQSYDRWVWVLAHILYLKKLGVKDCETLVSHKWVSDNLGGSHQDPIEYLAYHGKNWSNVVADVTNYYNQFEEEYEMLEQLQAQVTQLQQEIASLKEYNSMSQVPQWASDSVQSAVNAGLVQDPSGRSYDFYAIITVLHRKGLI